jgi:1-acyl-sn-glycerol-3-phosphate acyltransferase
VALVDSFKPFGIKGLKPVHTQVHFLPPIPYEEFAAMTPAAISRMLQERIAAHMESVLGYPVWTSDSKPVDSGFGGAVGG